MADPIQIAKARVPRAAHPEREQSELDVVVRCFASTVGADTAMLLGYDGLGKPILLSAWGLAERRSTVPWVSGSFLGRALKTNAASLEPAPVANNGGLGSGWDAVAAPIMGPNGALGGIYGGFEKPSHLPPDVLRWIADSHASLAALCMSGGAEVAATLRSSGVDQLTGCLRYERVVEMVKAEIERSARGDLALTCCFLDLDGFKGINDDHGHLEGNRVLAVAGDALRSASRPYDVVGRFGGDEFVMLLPQTGAREAERAIERIRWKVTAQVYEATGRVAEVSAGIAEWEREETPVDLMEAADNALQRAKAAGGARVAGVPHPGRLGTFRKLIRPGAGRSAGRLETQPDSE